MQRTSTEKDGRTPSGTALRYAVAFGVAWLAVNLSLYGWETSGLRADPAGTPGQKMRYFARHAADFDRDSGIPVPLPGPAGPVRGTRCSADRQRTGGGALRLSFGRAQTTSTLGMLVAGGIILLGWLAQYAGERGPVFETFLRLPIPLKGAAYAACWIMIMVFNAAGPRPFIYFRF